MLNYRFIFGLLIICVIFIGVAATGASAQSAINPNINPVTNYEAQIQKLLAKIETLNKQLNELRARAGQTLPPIEQIDPVIENRKHRVCKIVFRRTLTVGGQGDDVRGLQEFLRDEGFLNVDATGHFGTTTRDAVINWQTAQGIISSDAPSGVVGAGVFGPRSREHLRIRCKQITDRPVPTVPTAVHCTQKYRPVCAQPPMPQCPANMACPQVMPSPKTYDNRCVMRVAKARFIHDGECKTDTSIQAPIPRPNL